MEKRVLVVEDDPRVLRLLTDLLKADQYDVITATDGEAGLRAFTPGTIDVVVTDVKMPKMDGIEMMKAIKALDPDVEVIVLTGYGTLEMTIDVLRNGGYDFLKKPDEIPQRIRPTVQRAFEKRQLGLENHELVNALEGANAGLEKRVEAKTAELENANQQLENTLLTLAEINQTLREASFIDEATDLFNRQYFEQHISEDVERAKRYRWDFSLVIFEFSYPGQGDPANQETNNKILRWIADTIKNHLREGDLIARYDDNRFVLVLPQATDEAVTLCNRIALLLEGQKATDHFEYPVTARYGIAHCPQDSRSADMLLVAAERAIEQS